MANNTFTEGVRPGGLTGSKELRILLCYLVDSAPAPVTRAQIEEALLGEELVNYFLLAESLATLEQQGLLQPTPDGYKTTPQGHTVAQTLADDVPRTIRDAAVRGVILTQRYAAKLAAHQCDIVKTETGRGVRCAIGDEAGPLFRMELYMPDELSAAAVKDNFVEKGDEVYKLVLAALTGNRELAQDALEKLG